MLMWLTFYWFSSKLTINITFSFTNNHSSYQPLVKNFVKSFVSLTLFLFDMLLVVLFFFFFDNMLIVHLLLHQFVNLFIIRLIIYLEFSILRSIHSFVYTKIQVSNPPNHCVTIKVLKNKTIITCGEGAYL